MIDSLQLNDITIEVTKKKIKNLHLKICLPDGCVRISAPVRMSLNTIREFALSKLDWIKKHQKKIQERPNTLPQEYREGEHHAIWGQYYPLKIVLSEKRPKIILEQEQIYLHISSEASKEKKQKTMELWHRQQLQQVLPDLIAKWEPVMGVKVHSFAIQKMKTRWGSCSYRTGKIRFNLELAKKSFICLEYVVIHEMVHLLEPSHNHRFIAFMNQFMPEWRVHRKALKQ